MSPVSLFLVFLMIWLIVFFMSLPFGVNVSGDNIIGNAKSAPDNPNLKLKLLISLFISLIPTLIIYWLINNKILFNLIINFDY